MRTKALIIREYIVGESDKYITLFTKELGKVQAIAPKAKKHDQGFASSTQLFVYGDFMLTSYKDTYRLMNVDIIETFHNIRKDLAALSYASYIVEFIQSVTEAGLQQTELLKLTLNTLKAISSQNPSLKLIRRIFELRALGLLGFAPQLTRCVDCEEEIEVNQDAMYVFSAEAGGVVCSKCRTSYSRSIRIGHGTLYTMDYILVAPLNRLFHFTITDQIQKELSEVCDQYTAYYIDKTFKTIDFINKIEAL